MIIMIIFLVLSMAFIIFTAIYLNLKRKNNKLNIDTKDLQKEKISSKKNRKNLSNILNFKIVDDIIYLNNNRYSCVVKLGNIDYNMLSDREQEAIESILIQTALSINYPMQFFSTTEFIDTSKIISLIKENRQANKNIKKYQSYLIEYLQNLMENKTISIIKNYAIISYNGSYKNAKQELNRKAMLFKANLLRGNIICDVLKQEELYNLIHKELNKNSNFNVNNLIKGGEKLYVKNVSKRKKDGKRNI